MNVPFHPTFLKIMFARVFHPLGDDLAAFIHRGPGQGYCGLLGHESINESVKLKPSGSFAPRRSYKITCEHDHRSANKYWLDLVGGLEHEFSFP